VKRVVLASLMFISTFVSASIMDSTAIEAYESECGLSGVSVKAYKELVEEFDMAVYELIMNDGGKVEVTVLNGPGVDSFGFESMSYYASKVTCK